MAFNDAEPGSFDALDIGGRGVLFDTRTGESWILCGVDENKPFWKPIKFPSRAEKKPEEQ